MCVIQRKNVQDIANLFYEIRGVCTTDLRVIISTFVHGGQNKKPFVSHRGCTRVFRRLHFRHSCNENARTGGFFLKSAKHLF